MAGLAVSHFPWAKDAWEQFTSNLDSLHHGQLLVGKSGIGKREFALNMAAALLCETGGATGGACGNCRGCQLFQSGTHPDLHVLITEHEAKTGRLELLARYSDRYHQVEEREKANESKKIDHDRSDSSADRRIHDTIPWRWFSCGAGAAGR